jgi:hypothetical protein
MKRKFVQTFENFESGKINVPVDYWKSDSSGDTDSEPKDGSTQKLSTDVRDNLVKKYGERDAGRIIHFFDNLFKNLKETTSVKYPDSIFFYVIGDRGKKEYLMEELPKEGLFLCKWGGFWEFFQRLALDNLEVGNLVKFMMKHHLKREINASTARVQYGNHWAILDRQLK